MVEICGNFFAILKTPPPVRKNVQQRNLITVVFFGLFFSIPSTIFALPTQLPPSRNSSQPLGYTTGTPPPSPLRCMSSFLSRENGSAVPSLVDSRRIVRTHAARRHPPVQKCSHKKNVPLRDSNSRNRLHLLVVTRLNQCSTYIQ